MRKRSGLFLICLAALAGWISPLTSRAGGAAANFESANRLYEEGKFTEAAGAYETILQTGVASAPLYFNLGNARFKSGQIGRAIVAYRRAKQLTPRDPDVVANLRFARNQVAGPTLRVTRWERWLGTLNLSEWSGLSAGGLWLTFLLLTTMQLRPQWRQPLRRYVMAGSAAVLVFGGCLGLALAHCGTNTAVVIQRDVTVRNGPLEESQGAFTVHDGAELRVLDHKDNWLQVTDDNRRAGWLKREEVTWLMNS